MKSNDIRRTFLEFFAARGHRIVPSASLVPANDPTLLFTSAGMVPFKNAFLGRESAPAPRVADVQRCLRAGGKHNDLEQVGYTARHHTFFEMLGNWSFGDYFKREAIAWAWELLTEVWKLPPERLWVTVYHTDDEAWDIWASEIGVPADRIARIGDNQGALYASDNFWQMADTGPCGPCTEVFYDHDPDGRLGIAGGPPGSDDAEGDRFVEIWNLVFMQYDRAADGTLAPLPAPCVDTGMGLERIAAVLQGVHSNYDIDIFQHLIRAAAEATGTSDLQSPSLKVIADHIRAAAFLIADGVTPSNEGRGYVLRRIIRRAIRHGYQLGQTKPFFHELVAPLAEEMGDAYTELKFQSVTIEAAIRQEEVRFAETIGTGMRLLEQAIALGKGEEIPGATVFKLYDTYGFPVDLTADIARERGIAVDMVGFEHAMDQQRERARAASNFDVELSMGTKANMQFEATVKYDRQDTRFKGYTSTRADAKITTMFNASGRAEQLNVGEKGAVLLDQTPFYAESGGQVGDTGVLLKTGVRFVITDTRERDAGRLHIGQLEQGVLKVGDTVIAEVDAERRQEIVLNHSATHLLHAALRRLLGTHVTQKGSLVAADRLRFDFSHPQPLTAKDLVEIEDLVNAEIRVNAAAEVREMPYDEAIGAGAMALFGEKYGDNVRVMRFGDFSVELCGGTHVARTGDIGLFKIVAESGIAAGIRRIEAVTGAGALAFVREEEHRLEEIAQAVKSGREDAAARVRQLVERARMQERELAELRQRLASGAGGDLAAQAVDVAGHKLVAARLDGADAQTLRTTVDRLKDKLGSAAIVLGAVEDGKVRLAAGVTASLAKRLPASELVSVVAERVGGRGGGRADFAQAGGSEPGKLDEALAAVRDWVDGRLAGG
ncbi:MAG TPA: alanine--tRNA ligase [Gammaproteobacteria bacterium]|nr:alanine--tRNA ligase [Gammaproteobacteria bacterium]